MIEFGAALLAFLAAHLLPARPAIRARLIQVFGRRGYLAVFSLLSLALLGWVIAAAARAPHVPLWAPPAWSGWLAVIAMPAVLMLFGAGLFAPNPLSIAFRGGAFDPARPGAVALSRHPILAAFALWALVHLPANGDLTSVILFGGAAVFALVGMLILDRRRRELGAEWHRLAASTMALPGAAILLGRARVPTDGRTLAGAALGLFLYALLLAGLHRVLFGADPLAAL